MRKATNLKQYAPIPIPEKGTVFEIDGRKFTVNDVIISQNENKEYVAQCEIETDDCRMVLILTGPGLVKE